jgi:osmotically inducible protein OsmC
MTMVVLLGSGGTPPESLRTDARVSLRLGDEGPYISRIRLTTRGRVPGIDEETFQNIAATAKESCIVSRALSSDIDMQLTAELES